MHFDSFASFWTGLTWFGLALFIAIWRFMERGKCEYFDGLVIDRVEASDGDGGTLLYPVVEYRDQFGTKKTFRSQSYSFWLYYHINEFVTVRVSKHGAEIYTPKSDLVFFGVIGIVGMFLMVMWINSQI